MTLSFYLETSLMPVLEQVMTMYEHFMGIRSLVPFYSLSFSVSLTHASLQQHNSTSPDLNARDISHVTARRHN